MDDKRVLLVLASGFVMLLLITGSKGHFLSIEDLEEFYDLEEKLVATFQSYIEEQKAILEIVKERFEDQRERRPVVTDSDEYLSNPLNVYAMLKRLVSEWPLTMALLGGQSDDEEDAINLPTREEYQAAVHSIARLQQVYNISMADLLTGSAFQNTDNSSVFNAADCFSIAEDLYRSRYYSEAVDWLKEALKRVPQQDGTVVATAEQTDYSQPSVDELYEYLALAACFKGDQKESNYYFRRLYTTFPEFRPTQALIKDHLLAVNDSCKKLIHNESLKPRNHPLLYNLTLSEDRELSEEVGQLCRGVSQLQDSLHCHLVHHNKPHLRLMPVKVEELHLDPPILMFHDALYPKEMEHIIDSKRQVEERINGLVTEFWSSLDNNLSIEKAVHRRVQDLTGFHLHNQEKQVLVSNSAVGSEESLRHDADDREEFYKKKSRYSYGQKQQFVENEDVVATLMFYLEKPQAGGNIIFPKLGLSVPPTKGAAIFWFNLHPRGNLDLRNIHGSCPLLQGHQWTLTTWLGESPIPFEAHCSADKSATWTKYYL